MQSSLCVGLFVYDKFYKIEIGSIVLFVCTESVMANEKCLWVFNGVL